MAGGRQPIEVVVAKGKKHLTKKEIKDRKDVEIKIESNEIVCPDYLKGVLATEFNLISKRLTEIGIMTDLDVDAVARYVLAKQQYLSFSQQLSKSIKENDYLRMERLLNFQDRSFKQCHTSAMALGLTISSRCRLTFPKKEELPDNNKFNQFVDE